jgi:CRISPR-associated protein Cas1
MLDTKPARITDDTEWASRSAYWVEQSPSNTSRRRRERSKSTLVLCGHGLSLRMDSGTLLIRNGFTHYPQEREEYRYFRGNLDRPARIIVLDGSGSISFAVLDWLAEQDIPLIRISWTGEATTVIGGAGYSADRDKVEWQRATRANLRDRLEFSTGLIREKIRNSISTLQAAFPESQMRNRSVAKLEAEVDALADNPPGNIEQLRGIEGRAGAAYFMAWQNVPLRWKSNKRKPLPGAWGAIGPRSSVMAEKTSKNRNATHPINAMLNYAYAVLEAQVRIRLVSEGYDPTIGIMHHAYRNGPAFVLDHMEPLRPVVDREVLKIALGSELHPADFILTSDGVCRLNPQLAKVVVQAVSPDASRLWMAGEHA